MYRIGVSHTLALVCKVEVASSVKMAVRLVGGMLEFLCVILVVFASECEGKVAEGTIIPHMVKGKVCFHKKRFLPFSALILI